MADSNDKKPSIFGKLLEAGTAVLDAQILKAKSSVMNENLDDDFFYSKAVTEDPSYQVYSSGWKDKPGRLSDGHFRQMSLSNSVISAVIQTRQNQVSNHSKLVKSEKERGWMMCLRDEEAMLEKIKEELKLEMQAEQMAAQEMAAEGKPLPGSAAPGDEEAEPAPDMKKAEDAGIDTPDQPDDGDPSTADVGKTEDDSVASDPNADSKGDDEVEEYNFELERKAKEKLEQMFKDARKKAQDYLINCGILDNRPFETKKWTMDSALRAIVRDSLTYDRYGCEIVPDRAGRVHHWFPVDGATIKFASNRLADYKQMAENFLNLDILYPENKVEAMEKQKVLDLKPELLDKNAYKYVQVIRGKIERAYTEDEMKVGIRNVTTDIYANGYGVGELELVVSLVTGHMNAEFYNQAYFTQGFSAKGVLHIKAALNRRKVDTVRQQWQHMLKGSRNSFQTPIFAGMEDVNWIPLTQSHNDIGFEGWMRYLIKMICAIYQIDPHEIGIGFKDEGAGAGGMGGDATKEKIDQSKDKGLYPLLRHIENYLNENILKQFDKRFIMKFTGVTSENQQQSIERQEIERKFKKTVNELRAEDGLPPLPGMDDFIAGPEYAGWYGQFSKKAEEQQDKANQAAQDQLAAQGGMDSGDGSDPEEDNSFYGGDLESNLISPETAEVPGEPKDPNVKKANAALRKAMSARNKAMRRAKARPIKVEYYKIGK
jgi:hypothetical protein